MMTSDWVQVFWMGGEGEALRANHYLERLQACNLAFRVNKNDCIV